MSEQTNEIQDLSKYMMNQPVVNYGMIGHVQNGKSTITKALTGIATQKFSDEKKNNITMRLGYANAKIWECLNCKGPERFTSSDSSKMYNNCKLCSNNMLLVNHVSFVDCPGHAMLTSTMLNGSSVMDYTILVESASNDPIPAPQTAEHLVATYIANIPNKIICMNKIDNVTKAVTLEKIKKLNSYIKKRFIKQTKVPTIPVSGTFNCNIDVICDYISRIEIPKRNLSSNVKMIVVRSFDINKQGIDIRKLNGGVVGGTILQGILKVGDSITLYPGVVKKVLDPTSKKSEYIHEYSPLEGTVLSMNSDKNNLLEAIPGGLVGIQLSIDPSFSRDDGLIGSILQTKSSDNESDDIIKVYDKIVIQMDKFLMDESKVVFNKKDILSININANNVKGLIHSYIKQDKYLCLQLNNPIAVDMKNSNVTIMLHDKITIIGRGHIIEGVECVKI